MTTTAAEPDQFEAGRVAFEDGRLALAVESFVDVADDPSHPRRLEAVALCAHLSLRLGRPHEAIAFAERLRALSPDHARLADVMEGVGRVRTGQPHRALRLLQDAQPVALGAVTYGDTDIRTSRAAAIAAVRQPSDAMADLVAAVTATPGDLEAWKVMGTILADGRVDPSPVVELLDRVGVDVALAALGQVNPAGVDRLAEALWRRRPGDEAATSLVSYVGTELSAERALEWSIRLRATGLDDECPLLGIAAHSGHLTIHRIRAAVIAGTVFGDERARPLIELAAHGMMDDQLDSALRELVAEAPDYADSFVVGAAWSSRRALLLAATLWQLDLPDIALSLVAHGWQLHASSPSVFRADVVDIVPGEVLDALAEAAAGAGLHDAAAALAR